MNDFVIKTLTTDDIELELEKIGFDVAYRAKASDKFKYKTFKVFDLTLPQANILKQTALSFGADCGVHREVLTNKIDKTDVILGGSFSQLKKISDKLKLQPFSLKDLATKIDSLLICVPRRTKLVGILNITPDSFSDGGKYFDTKKAIEHVSNLIQDGADIIDIGAESTRPGAVDIAPQEQISRLKPLLKELPEFLYSIDTRSSEVAEFALDNGIQIVNDVSGLDFDKKMIDVVSKYQSGLVIQHSGRNIADICNYKDVVEEVWKSLYKKAEYANLKNVKNIILDIGIGFGKTKEDNFELLNRIDEFFTLNYPLMVGVSRKSILGITDNDNDLKDALSSAISYPLMQKGVDYLRVHNVKLHKQLLNLVR